VVNRGGRAEVVGDDVVDAAGGYLGEGGERLGLVVPGGGGAVAVELVEEEVAVPDEAGFGGAGALGDAAAEGVVGEGHLDGVRAGHLGEHAGGVPGVRPGAAVGLLSLDEVALGVEGEGGVVIVAEDAAADVAAVGVVGGAVDVADGVEAAVGDG